MVEDFESGLPVPARLYSTPDNNIPLALEEILSSSADAVPGQYFSNFVLTGSYAAGDSFTRKFDTSKDLSSYNAMSFWYKGSNTGEAVKVKLLDGQADPAPSVWTQVWSDEFNGTAGTAPDTNNWNHEIGGPGWGNNEWEYYTTSTDNAAVDGTGNLVITAKPEDTATTSLECVTGSGTGTPSLVPIHPRACSPKKSLILLMAGRKLVFKFPLDRVYGLLFGCLEVISPITHGSVLVKLILWKTLEKPVNNIKCTAQFTGLVIRVGLE